MHCYFSWSWSCYLSFGPQRESHNRGRVYFYSLCYYCDGKVQKAEQVKSFNLCLLTQIKNTKQITRRWKKIVEKTLQTKLICSRKHPRTFLRWRRPRKRWRCWLEHCLLLALKLQFKVVIHFVFVVLFNFCLPWIERKKLVSVLLKSA